MWLSQLRLTNFRNYRGLRLEPHTGILLFSGANGQGKTNLLEAVYVLATTRSPRTSVERELLSWRTPEDVDLAAVTAPFARLDARVRRMVGEIHLELTFEGERSTNGAAGAVSRSIKVNGLATRATGLVGQLPVVYFSPADVDLAGGSPAARRQYLNLALSQASSNHLRALQRYNRVLLQRNQALRLVRERRQPAAALEPWTEQMISWGAQILHARLKMVRDMEACLASIFRDLAGGSETLRVVYRSTVCGNDFATTPSTVDIEVAFRERQAQVAPREIDQAVSLVGPHRDDFSFVLDEVDLNTYGSRGQQRLAVLALKLAEADWMRSSTGEIPVVLLDDMLSELDPERRQYVLRRVAEPEPAEGRQVWITTTEPDLLSADQFVTGAQRFFIEAGQVRTA
jgi:DNA replication and repair protein RecF